MTTQSLHFGELLTGSLTVFLFQWVVNNKRFDITQDPKGGGGVLGLMFGGYVPLASQSPYPIIVYSVANYRPHLSHFLENIIFAIPA